jgi:FMN-dependent NADH-azoreductase
VARGGLYGSDSGVGSAEHTEHYLRAVFALIGTTEPEFVLAEGLASGKDDKAKVMEAVYEAIGQLDG